MHFATGILGGVEKSSGTLLRSVDIRKLSLMVNQFSVIFIYTKYVWPTCVI